MSSSSEANVRNISEHRALSTSERFEKIETLLTQVLENVKGPGLAKTTGIREERKNEKHEKILNALKDQPSMTMKEIAELLSTSLQTAHVVANEIAKTKQAVMAIEPYGKNKRLRLLSPSFIPVDLAFNRVGKG